MAYNPSKLEKEIIEFWKKSMIRKKALSFRKDSKRFYFLDGPPYATGYIHMGTAWNKIIKDFYIRFFRMKGLNVWAQPGYDTHGLPIENKVEKKLDLKKKDDIEKFGIGKFNRECRNYATKFIDVMNSQFNNLGVWMDWENPYLTLDNSYIEGSWHTFRKAYEKGFLYKGVYPVHVCSHCATAVAYNEIEYFKATDPSIAVKFRVKGKENEHLVIWTTTPWTLPANTGIMVNPKYDYAKVRIGDEILIIAKKLVKEAMETAGIEDYEIAGTVKGKELEGVEYESPLIDAIKLQEKISPRVILSEQFVTLEKGTTGLVHTAPGHGMEDFKAGTKAGLDIVCPVKLDGTYDESVGQIFHGKYVKDANPLIIEILEQKDAVLFRESIVHDYPKCWRCSTPLLQIAVPQWFFRVTAFRKKLLDENRKVNWIPSWGKKRFDDWLNNLGDWPISRQRYWGIPLPIWTCDKCDEVKVIGSVKELPEKVPDLHRPFIDKVTFGCKCGGKMKRIPDVLDVWFDSSVAGWASLGYPDKKELFESMFPADFILEGSDQIRGWFNSQIISSVMTFDRAPYKAVLMHGLVLDARGIKMSKSLGNVVSPEEVIEKFGRDVLRFYLLESAPENDFYFSWDDVNEVNRKFIIFYNVCNFLKTYAGRKPSFDEKKLKKEDSWIISKINSLIRMCGKSNSCYKGYESVQALDNFIVNDFSRSYIKLIRERTSPTYEGDDKEAAVATLYYVMERIVKLLAPIAPHITEHIYRTLNGMEESVHMTDWPSADRKVIDKTLEKNMDNALKIVEAIHAARQENNLRLRWPLRKAVVAGDRDVLDSVKALSDVIKELVNVKEIEIGKIDLDVVVKPDYRKMGPSFGNELKKVVSLLEKQNPKKVKKEIESRGKVKIGKYVLGKDMLLITEKVSSRLAGKEFRGGSIYLDTKLDRELMEEAMVRELIRKVQIMRKEAGLKVTETINLSLDGENKILENWKSEIEKGTSSKSTIGKISGSKKDKLEFDGKVIKIGF